MTTGIHHITAIASDPQQTYDFYTKILGLRLVKKSVNQDDVSTYHLFFGDRQGHPGMDLTFFTFQPPHPGKRGNGLLTTISLTVPQESLNFWQQRFDQQGVSHTGITSQYSVNKITFYDPDNQQLELVGSTSIKQTDQLWSTSEVSSQNAIHSFYSATLSVHDKSLIVPILVYVFEYQQIVTQENISIFQTTAHSNRASIIKIDQDHLRDFGQQGAGTVHHIAFRATDDQHQQELRNRVLDLGIRPTEVIDRYYFKSVYFQTPAGILFEIATDEPGFTADESELDLGKKLALPPFLESQRAHIEANLPPIIP